MAMRVQTETKLLFGVQINQQRLEELLSKGNIANHVKDDIAIKAWATTHNFGQQLYPFDSPFIRLGRSEKNLSYAEKVAQSIKMLDIALNHVSTGTESGYGPSDYITSDFDLIMNHRVEDIVKYILEHENIIHKVRFNHNSHSYDPFFIRFDFQRDTTQLFMENIFADKVLEKDAEIRELFANEDKLDMIIPFSILPAFPVYNVDSITFVDMIYNSNGPIKATLYDYNGKHENINLPGNFFSL